MKKTTFDKALLGFLALVAILFMGVTLSSCSSDDDEVPVKKKKEVSAIVGTWKQSIAEKVGEENGEVVPEKPVPVYEVYKEDGTYLKTNDLNKNEAKVEEGTFTVKNDSLFVEVKGTDAVRKDAFKFVIKENKLSKQQKGEEIATYTRFKVTP